MKQNQTSCSEELVWEKLEDWKWSCAGRDGAQASLPARDASVVPETNEELARIGSEKENSFFRN